MSFPAALSRRDLLLMLFRIDSSIQQAEAPDDTTLPRTAVVQGRYCLAYQHNFCSVCSERCPIEGAVVVEQNVPRINAALCDGCGICHQVCPAPRNAILMMRPRANPSPPVSLNDRWKEKP